MKIEDWGGWRKLSDPNFQRKIALGLAILYIPFMVYALMNLSLIKEDPCNYCEQRTGKMCVQIAQTSPTGLIYSFDTINLSEYPINFDRGSHTEVKG